MLLLLDSVFAEFSAKEEKAITSQVKKLEKFLVSKTDAVRAKKVAEIQKLALAQQDQIKSTILNEIARRLTLEDLGKYTAPNGKSFKLLRI